MDAAFTKVNNEVDFHFILLARGMETGKWSHEHAVCFLTKCNVFLSVFLPLPASSAGEIIRQGRMQYQY